MAILRIPDGQGGYVTVPAIKGDKGDTGPAGASTWGSITDKPAAFPPEGHKHTLADIKDAGNIATKQDVDTALGTARAYTDALIVVGNTGAKDGKLHVVYE